MVWIQNLAEITASFIYILKIQTIKYLKFHLFIYTDLTNLNFYKKIV